MDKTTYKALRRRSLRKFYFPRYKFANNINILKIIYREQFACQTLKRFGLITSTKEFANSSYDDIKKWHKIIIEKEPWRKR